MLRSGVVCHDRYTHHIQTFRQLLTTTIRTSSMDRPHATGGPTNSAVPDKVQQKAPKGLEEALPDSVHPTGKEPGQSTHKTHALNDGEDTIVPKKIQEKLPEKVERAVPNIIHNTGDNH
ncbi:hypothetical protein V8F33_009624 [Rhypophila sp. PSN 637]